MGLEKSIDWDAEGRKRLEGIYDYKADTDTYRDTYRDSYDLLYWKPEPEPEPELDSVLEQLGKPYNLKKYLESLESTELACTIRSLKSIIESARRTLYWNAENIKKHLEGVEFTELDYEIGLLKSTIESDERAPCFCNAEDIGREFIDIPTARKKEAEQQESELEPPPPEFCEILVDLSERMDPAVQAAIDARAERLENAF